jgi:hypothetical protein
MPKILMSSRAPDLPPPANHICPKCNRPIPAICVGKHLEDAPLGRGIICLDCAEAFSQSEELEDELCWENEVTPSTSTTINGVSYQVTNLLARGQESSC